jgi:hypothetical protein
MTVLALALLSNATQRVGLYHPMKVRQSKAFSRAFLRLQIKRLNLNIRKSFKRFVHVFLQRKVLLFRLFFMSCQAGIGAMTFNPKIRLLHALKIAWLSPEICPFVFKLVKHTFKKFLGLECLSLASFPSLF